MFLDACTFFSLKQRATTLQGKLSASIPPCKIRSVHFFQNIETGLEILFLSAILLCTITMNCVQLVASFSDLLMEQGNKTEQDQFHEVSPL